MKITARQYATVLYDTIKGKTDSQIKVAIADFIKVLKENNNLVLTEKIIAEFEKTYNKNEKIVDAEIVCANDLDTSIIKILQNYIAKITDAKEVKLGKSIDKKILGGVIIKYGDKILDGSLKSRLVDFKNGLVK